MNQRDQQYFIENKQAKEINLKTFFELIKKRFWIIALVTIIASLVGYFYSSLNDSPLYQTSRRIIVNSDSDYMKTLMVMIKDPIIMEKVKEDLKLSKSAEGIAGQIEVSQIDESKVIQISVIGSDPKKAVAIANMTAVVFKSEIAKILEFRDVQLLSEAEENYYPINGDQNRVVIIAFIFGLITGIGLVFLIESLDGTVNKTEEVEEILGVPVLGIVSNMNRKKLAVKKGGQSEIEIRGETVGIK